VIVFREIIGALWLVFIVFWIVSAFGAKRNVSRVSWRRQAGLRLIVIALILLALRVPMVTDTLRHARPYFVTLDPRLGIAGTILCALGVGLAIWARVYLGRNWGLPMSRKAAPELVTSGPYAFVRHPIYAGIMLAMLGSAVAESILWVLPFLIATAYFIYSARSEERTMGQEFPEQYAAYRGRTKMLVPFVL